MKTKLLVLVLLLALVVPTIAAPIGAFTPTQPSQNQATGFFSTYAYWFMWEWMFQASGLVIGPNPTYCASCQ